MSAENLDFLDKISIYRKTVGEFRQNTAMDIYNEFIADDAEQKLNLDAPIVDHIEANILNGVPNLQVFDGAVNHVLFLIQNCEYQRFVKTDQYKKGNKVLKITGPMTRDCIGIFYTNFSAWRSLQAFFATSFKHYKWIYIF